MRTKHILGIFVLLAFALPARPAQAGGVVTVCDEAHLLAALVGGGTVTFACSGTITLTSTIVIAADTTIDGSGQAVTISGNNAVRVFTVNSGVELNLDDLSVISGAVSGYPGGAGIFNSGSLNATGSTFSDNIASQTNGNGGAIYNSGMLTVTNSVFSGNRAAAGGGIYGEGGAIINVDGTATVSNSVFVDNSANNGGSIANFFGTLNVSGTTFSSNLALLEGGAIFNSAALTVNSSTFSNNNASGGGGGGIGIYGYGAMVTVSNSTFSGNGAYVFSGGIANQLGTVAVSNSTLSRNVSGGIFNSGGTITLKNTIVANSLGDYNCLGITDGGGNLSYPDTTCPGINTDPMLGPLQDNGGPTWTLALLPGSPAIDAGIDAVCAADPVNNLDQRGVSRPQGPHCDIGAVEQILEPAAVNLSTFHAQSITDTITPIMVAGLLLAALVAVGVRRRPCHTI